MAETDDDIAYLDGLGVAATSSPFGILLGPSSFSSEEFLVRVLGHERTHMYQEQVLKPSSSLTDTRTAWEAAAYDVEDVYAAYWRENTDAD